jgi:predicted GNAT family N-acyltransferase
MSTSVQIGFAACDPDRQAIYRLRYEIYVEEMGYQFPSEHQDRQMPDEDDRPCHLLYARDGDQVVGTLRIHMGKDAPFTDEEYQVYQLERFLPFVPAERIAILTRFMARPGYRSGEVPARLLQEMFRFILDSGVRLLFLDCRPHLINSYARLGFRPYGRTINHPIAGLLVPMVLVIDDVAHLKRINSRFLPLVEGLPSDPRIAEQVTAILGQPGPVHTLSDPDTWEGWPEVLDLLSDEADTHITLFDHVSDEEIEKLLSFSHVIQCEAGDHIISEDADDRSIFVVLQGTVEVVRGGEVVSVLPRGSVFGEISFLLQRRRTADVFAASSDVRILCIREKGLTELIRSGSQVAARLLLNLARILAEKLAQED